VTVRELGGPAELDVLEPLWAAMHAHHAAFAPPAGFAVRPLPDSWARRRGALAARMAAGDGTVLLAEDGPRGAPLGFAAVSVRPDARTAVRTAGLEAALDSLVVAPDGRRGGTGRALVDAARTWAAGRGATALLVDVRAANDSALAFYAALGGQPAFVTVALPPPGPSAPA